MRFSTLVSENGRSMIEMLGVLAIVGILSVGGISGFNKAMRTYRLNNATEEFVTFVRDLIHFHDPLIKLANNSTANHGITSTIAAMGIVPPHWSRYNGVLLDSIKHTISVTVSSLGITINYELKHKGYQERSGDEVKEHCRLLFIQGALPYKDSIKSLWTHRYGDGESSGHAGRFLGGRYCSKGANCLHTANMSDILQFCETCENYENCTLVFSFE